ncbi:hypothetical protein HU200_066479 [Digitaria exilis]|uniref:Uncharacterized protein n=1 Tax=Digitaria exilis TaxID=1010633 RepID=A0A835A061_9POAL|nr:hypothetical protein HU200_066479 [Digitaria exilis]
MVEVTDDGDECAIVRVKKFEGSTMLAEVDRTDDNGVTSRTRRRKVRKLQKSQLFASTLLCVNLRFGRIDMVEVTDDGDECAVFRVKKFEGSTMLVEVDRTDNNGVASRIGRCKVRKLQKSQLFSSTSVCVNLRFGRTDLVEEAYDGDECAIVMVKKFEGSTMLVEVDRTDDNGVASRTGKCKVRKLQKSRLVHGKDYSKGTVSDPIDL